MSTLLLLARGQGKSYRDLSGRLILEDMPFDVVVFVNKANRSHFDTANPRIRIEEVRWSDDNSVRKRACELHRQNPFSGIGTLEESMVDLAADLREVLGIPGMVPSAARRFRDKTDMKRLLANSSVAVPAFSSCADRGAVQDLLSRHKKIMLKPVDGQGSRGVVCIESAGELEEWYNRCEHPELFQAEEYVDGVLYHVNALVCDGNAIITACAPYLPGMANIDFTSGAPFVTVMLVDGDIKRRLEQTSDEVIAAFALCNGVTHLECFVTPDNRIVFCEIAIRPGGGGIVWMIEAQYGVNFAAASLLLEMDCSHLIRLPTSREPHVAGLMGFRNKESGFVKTIPEANIFQEEWIKLFKTDVLAGDFVVKAAHCTDYLGLLIFLSRDLGEFEQRRDDLYSRFYNSFDIRPL